MLEGLTIAPGFIHELVVLFHPAITKGINPRDRVAYSISLEIYFLR